MKLIAKIIIICFLMLAIGHSQAPLNSEQSAQAKAISSASPNFFSGSRLFLPMTYKDGDYSTGVMLINLEESEATLTMVGYHDDGIPEDAFTDTIPGLGAKTYIGAATLPVSNGFMGGMVVSSDKQLASIVTLINSERNMYEHYMGSNAGSTMLFLPLLMNNRGGFTTWYSVQNTGSSDATVDILYSDGTTTTDTIPVGSSKFYYQDQEDHENGSVFSGTITSDQPVVVVVAQTNGETLYAYTGFNSGVVDPAFPMIQQNNNGYRTGIQIQNIGEQETEVTLEFTPDTFGTSCQETISIEPTASATFAFRVFNGQSSPGTSDCVDEQFVGSAKVVTNSAEQPLLGLVHQVALSGSNGASYKAFDPATGTNTVHMPLLMDRRGGFNTSFALQHVGGPASDVICTFHNTDYVIMEYLDVGGSIIRSQEDQLTEGYADYGLCQAEHPDTKMVAVVNQIKPSESQDLFLVYEGINLESEIGSQVTPGPTRTPTPTRMPTEMPPPDLPEPGSNTLFVPLFTDVDYLSGVQIVNLENTEATITVSGYSPDGTAVEPFFDIIPPGGSVTYLSSHSSFPDEFSGALVVSSDKQITALVNILSTDFTGLASYASSNAGSTTLSLPLLTNDLDGFTTWYSIQNAGSAEATVTVEYSDGTTVTESIPVGAAKFFYQDQEEHEEGSAFAATISSDQPIAAAVVQESEDMRLAYTGAISETPHPFFPVINQNNANYMTGIQLQNSGDETTEVTLEYTPTTFGAIPIGTACYETISIEPGDSVLFGYGVFGEETTSPGESDCVTERFVGSAKVSENSTNQPLTGVAYQRLPNVNGDGYVAFNPDQATHKVLLPLIMDRNSDFFTGFIISHIDGPASTIACTFSDTDYEVEFELAVDGSLTDLQQNKISDRYVGAGVCTAANENTKIVALVNQVRSGATEDYFLTYAGINLTSEIYIPESPPTPEFDYDSTATPTPSMTPYITPTPTPTSTPTESVTPYLTRTLTSTPTPTPEYDEGATIYIMSEQQDLKVGERYQLDIIVDPGTREVNGAQIHAKVDPAYLKILSLQPDQSTLSRELDAAAFDAETGIFRYGAGLVGELTGSQPFRVLQVEVEALAATDSTRVEFILQELPPTNVAGPTGSVLDEARNAEITIQNQWALYGTIGLQGRPAVPDASKSISVTVEVYPAGSMEMMDSFVVKLDQSGRFTYTELISDTYDLRLLSQHTLATKTRNVRLNDSDEPQFLGMLKEGDITQDNVVQLDDFSILSGAFHHCNNEPEFDDRTDLNEDDCTSVIDFTLLAGNFNVPGDIEYDMQDATPLALSESATAKIGLEMDTVTGKAVGESFEVTVFVDPNGTDVRGATAHITFDPDFLTATSVELLAEEALPTTLQDGEIDNETGSVTFSKGALNSTATERFELAKLTMAVKQENDGSSLAFSHDFPATNVTGATGSLVNDENFIITQRGEDNAHLLYLPVILR